MEEEQAVLYRVGEALEHFKENGYHGDLIRDAWVKQQLEGIAHKINTHEEDMATNIEQFTKELREAWLLQQRELGEAIKTVQVGVSNSGNGIRSEWEKTIVERLEQHGKALRDADASFRKWSETQTEWMERIRQLDKTKIAADLRIRFELTTIDYLF